MKEYPNYYAIIPSNVRYDKDISSNAKLLYGEITALSNKDAKCWASNKYFAELYGVSKVTISRWVKELVDAGYVLSELIYKENSKEVLSRFLSISNTPHIKYDNTPPLKYDKGPHIKYDKDNNTSINITSNNIYKENPTENNPLNNSSTKGKEKESSAKEKESTELENLRIFWNSKKIIECRKITPEIKKTWSRLLKEYPKGEIAQSIENYSKAVNDPDYFFKHKWNLPNFLKNSKALPDFINGGEKAENYKSQQDMKVKKKDEFKNPYIQKL